MLIHHRGIYSDRFDAPFGIGTMIWAKDCHNHCKGCFHQDRFNLPIIEESSTSVIEKVLENPFTQGIILAGFEWTEQYRELLDIIREARDHNLEIILYTHSTINEIEEQYPELLNITNMYIKCGEYDETKLALFYESYGVSLSSTNQRIYKIGCDV